MRHGVLTRGRSRSKSRRERRQAPCRACAGQRPSTPPPGSTIPPRRCRGTKCAGPAPTSTYTSTSTPSERHEEQSRHHTTPPALATRGAPHHAGEGMGVGVGLGAASVRYLGKERREVEADHVRTARRYPVALLLGRRQLQSKAAVGGEHERQQVVLGGGQARTDRCHDLSQGKRALKSKRSPQRHDNCCIEPNLLLQRPGSLHVLGARHQVEDDAVRVLRRREDGRHDDQEVPQRVVVD